MSIAVDIIGLRTVVSQAAANALFDHHAMGVQERWRDGEAPPPRQPWDTGPEAPQPDRLVLTAWFEKADRVGVLAALRPWLDTETEIVWREEEERDWEAESKAQFRPFTVGPLTIAPPWEPVEGALLIEPGSGFGTGEHPTTRQALALFQGTPPCKTVLDVGCGSGILALAAAKTGCTVHGTDIEAPALSNARHNAMLNGLTAVFDDSPLPSLKPADLVFANLHAELLVSMAEDLRRLTGRHLLLAGILHDREQKVLDALKWPVHTRLVDGEWVALRMDRP